jgi:hypothetical protein
VRQPLAAKLRSYSKILTDWSTEDEGGHIKRVQFLHVSAEDAGKFAEFWESHGQKFKKLDLKLELCVSEQSDDAYKEFGKVLQAIWKVLEEVMGIARQGRTRNQSQVYLWYNEAGEDKTRPDVALCARIEGVRGQAFDISTWIQKL